MRRPSADGIAANDALWSDGSRRIMEDAMRNGLFVGLALALLAACTQARPTTLDSGAGSASASSAKHDSSSIPAPIALITTTCGESTLSLMCSATAAASEFDCTHPSIRLARQSPERLQQPPEMSAYAPVALACTRSHSGLPYFVVQFGELPEGCGFCEWFYVYSTDGEALTHSKPAILGTGTDRSPNNREFDALSRRLGLSRPVFNYAQCDQTMDRDGHAVCLKEVKDDRTGAR